MILWLAQQAQDTPDETLIVWGAVLLALAIGLLLMELFVPSGGLIGVLAGICAIGSLVAFFRYNITLGFAMTTAYFVLSPLILWGLFKFWINSPVTRRLILGAEDDQSLGDDGDGPSAMSRTEMERRERLAQLQQLIGAEGKTVTPLRPVGVVRIQGERIDALAETGVIAANADVVVTDVYDNQVKVRPRRPDPR